MEHYCSNCNYSSDFKPNVKRHIESKRSNCKDAKIQERKIEIKCKCEKKFTTKRSMERHQKNTCKEYTDDKDDMMEIDDPEFVPKGVIYLLQEREFIKTGEQVYKIGRSKQFVTRMSSYPTGSRVHLVVSVSDPIGLENKLKQLFVQRFKHRNDYGSEYFEGSLKLMMDTITSHNY